MQLNGTSSQIVIADRSVDEHRTGAPFDWSSGLVPSVADLIFILLLIAMTHGILAAKLLGDADIGWHIRNGEQMIESHHVTRVDLFSGRVGAMGEIESGRPWYAWEWLFDASIALVDKWMGLNGVVFVSAFVIAFTFALVFRLALMRSGNLPVTAVFLLLSFGATSIHLLARPHIVSWLLAVIWFQLLDSAEIGKEHRARLFWLPVLMFLWANLHGGFVLGFALLGLYLVSAACRWFFIPEQRPQTTEWLRNLGVVTTLSAVASLLNPFGYKLHVHIAQYLSDRWLMDHIDEFLSPNFYGIAQQCFSILLIVTVMAMAARRANLRASQLLVVVFAVYTGLYASRNLPVASMLLTLITVPVISRTISEAATSAGVPAPMRNLFARFGSFASRMKNMEFRFVGHLWPVLLTLFGFFVCFVGGKLSTHQLMDAHFDAKRFPVEAVQSLSGPDAELVFAPDSWGGYLIYRLYPRYRVYVDDRHDFYGSEFLKSYLRTISIAPDWKEQLEKTRVHWVLVPGGSSLANALKENGNWKVVYTDQTAVLFRHAQ